MADKNTKKAKEGSIKDSLTRLKEITNWFDEADEVDVEEGLEKVKEGVGLIKHSRERFAELENEFEDVKKELENDSSES